MGLPVGICLAVSLMSRIMIELEGSDEPAWTWLEYQHAHIVERMKGIAQKAQDAVKSGSDRPKVNTRRTDEPAAITNALQTPSSSTAYLDTLKKHIAQSSYDLHPHRRQSCSILRRVRRSHV